MIKEIKKHICLLSIGTLFILLLYTYWHYEYNKKPVEMKPVSPKKEFIYANLDNEYNQEVLAKIGQFEITLQDFEKEINYRGGKYKNALSRKALLEEMIVKKLFLNKAYEIDLPNNTIVQRAYEHLLTGKIRERYIENERKKIIIHDEELKAYYHAHKEQYKTANQRQFAILFFKKRMKNVNKERKLIQEKFMEIKELDKNQQLPKASKGFGSYAIDYSEHQVSRYKGGKLGWFSQDKKTNWEQEVVDIGFQLQHVAEVSKILETKRGYYLVRFMAEKKEKYETFEKVKAKIKHQLLFSKQQIVKNEFEKLLKQEFNIEIDFRKLETFGKATQVHEKETKPPVVGLQ